MKIFSHVILLSMMSATLVAQGTNLVDPVGRPLNSKELSAPARFMKIKGKDALDETAFWSRQLSEHALFLHLGMETEPFKKRGLEIHKKWEAFRDTLSEKTLPKVLPLARELRAYKMAINKSLNEGKWVGWIFPSFVRHIIQELDFFVDKLNGVRYSPKDEVDFWNHINSDHAAFESHLLDPYERKLSAKANALSEKIATLPDSEEDMFIKISLNAAAELDAFNKKGRSLAKANKLQSVIHPVLMDHVIREGERSKAKLKALQQSVATENEPAVETENEPAVDTNAKPAAENAA
jgi:hypothetical protein